MQKEKNVIVVFTARSPGRIVREGGSQAWVLNPARAKQCDWLVCTQNRHNPDHEFSDATEPHGSAFLLCKISGVTKSKEDTRDRRWLITISQFARINYEGVWDHRRNPVRYASLEELGISLDGLNLQTLTTPSEGQVLGEPIRSESRPAGLTIPDAKKALAETFGVKPEAIEITIRG
jgi:hypothetical protein